VHHAVIIGTTTTRNDFTEHGSNLSVTAVERMANLMGKKIKTLLTKQRKLPFIIQWKDNKDIMQEEDKINIKSDSPPNSNVI
jgi:hypothetical protein